MWSADLVIRCQDLFFTRTVRVRVVVAVPYGHAAGRWEAQFHYEGELRAYKSCSRQKWYGQIGFKYYRDSRWRHDYRPWLQLLHRWCFRTRADLNSIAQTSWGTIWRPWAAPRRTRGTPGSARPPSPVAACWRSAVSGMEKNECFMCRVEFRVDFRCSVGGEWCVRDNYLAGWLYAIFARHCGIHESVVLVGDVFFVRGGLVG